MNLTLPELLKALDAMYAELYKDYARGDLGHETIAKYLLDTMKIVGHAIVEMAARR